MRVAEDREDHAAPSELDMPSGIDVERGKAYQLWWRDAGGAPDVVVVRKAQREIVVQELRAPDHVVFRSDGYPAVRTWLTNAGYELAGQRPERTVPG